MQTLNLFWTSELGGGGCCANFQLHVCFSFIWLDWLCMIHSLKQAVLPALPLSQLSSDWMPLTNLRFEQKGVGLFASAVYLRWLQEYLLTIRALTAAWAFGSQGFFALTLIMFTTVPVYTVYDRKQATFVSLGIHWGLPLYFCPQLEKGGGPTPAQGRVPASGGGVLSIMDWEAGCFCSDVGAALVHHGGDRWVQKQSCSFTGWSTSLRWPVVVSFEQSPNERDGI